MVVEMGEVGCGRLEEVVEEATQAVLCVPPVNLRNQIKSRTAQQQHGLLLNKQALSDLVFI